MIELPEPGCMTGRFSRYRDEVRVRIGGEEGERRRSCECVNHTIDREWNHTDQQLQTLNSVTVLRPTLRRSNGHQSSNSKSPVQSAYYRKGKRRKDFNSTKSLWDNGKPHNLPGNESLVSEGSTCPNLFVRLISPSSRLNLTRPWMLVTIMMVLLLC